MAKVRYKAISSEMEKLASPAKEWMGRSSIGSEEQVGEYYFLPIEKLKPYKHQARKVFNEQELEQLAKTITHHGIRQPLSIIPSSDMDGLYEVISGERRLRAAQIAGLKTVPCLIIKDKNSIEELALIENIQRADLHPVELGEAYKKIIDKKEHGKISLLAAKISKSISSISECLKLAELPDSIKKHLVENNIRSKITFRRLYKTRDVSEMNTILGIDKASSLVPNKNILRIYLNLGNFTIESKQVQFLDASQKEILKEKLSELINSI